MQGQVVRTWPREMLKKLFAERKPIDNVSEVLALCCKQRNDLKLTEPDIREMTKEKWRAKGRDSSYFSVLLVGLPLKENMRIRVFVQAANNSTGTTGLPAIQPWLELFPSCTINCWLGIHPAGKATLLSYSKRISRIS